MAVLSAHDLIHITYKIKTERRNKREITCRDFRHFNDSEFLFDFERQDWLRVFSKECIDRKVDLLNSALLECINKHAPLRVI